MTDTSNYIGCAAGCGAKVADMDAANAAAWSYLEITKRWRCTTCTRELYAVNKRGPVESPLTPTEKELP